MGGHFEAGQFPAGIAEQTDVGFAAGSDGTLQIANARPKFQFHRLQFLRGFLLEFLEFHTAFFEMNLDLHGSLYRASSSASLADASGIPSISNITVPGLTTAT